MPHRREKGGVDVDTVLIVEDERSVRQYLKKLIQDSGVPVKAILECGDGQSALEIVQKYRVDAMFTGIGMPGIDGVALVRRVRELDHPPMVVVITDSDELQHVIEMMRNGALEYVLKPIEPERMADIMRMLEQRADAARRRGRVIDLLTKRMVFSFLLDQRPSPEEAELLKRLYEPLIAEAGYVVCIFQSDVPVRENTKILLLRQTPDQTLCILEEKDLRPFLRSELPGGAAGVSGPHYTVDELPRAHDEALAARALAFCRGGHVFSPLPEQASPSPEAARLLGEQAHSQRLQLLGTKKVGELAARWEELFQAAERGAVPPEQTLDELCAFSGDVTRVYSGSLDGGDLLALERCGRPLAFPSLADYRRFFMEWLLSFHEKLAERLEFNHNQARIAQAIEYMREHYAEDLNMAVVSNYISMNYSLFSHLFKLQTGTSFVNYLKQMRIRQARRLLAETDMKVVDVSRRVGYVNEKNFMKVFKALCGVSPSEYRRNMQNGQ